MSTKSKRRYARRHATAPASQRRGDSLSKDDRRIAGEIMSALLAAFSFGALAHEQ